MTSNILGLFNPVHDRQQTMLAYEANYFPYWLIKDHHQLVYHNVLFLTKEQVLNRCDELMQNIHDLPMDRLYPDKPFKIHWAFGNVPTELEWEKLYGQSYLVVDYRISPVIKDGGGRVCLLSLHDKGYYQP